MIFCVEDDPNIRELEVYTLQSVGFKALGVGSGDELFKALECGKPTLILLDIMLPGEDGLSLLKRLRSDKRTAQVPVIMATAKGSEFDKVHGLDNGADDYIAKPFGMMEMVSRVKAVLRRYKQEDKQSRLTAGELVMEIDKHRVMAGGKSSWRDLCVCFLNYAMPLSKRLMALKMPLTEAKLMLCSVPTPKMRRPPGTRSSM